MVGKRQLRTRNVALTAGDCGESSDSVELNLDRQTRKSTNKRNKKPEVKSKLQENNYIDDAEDFFQTTKPLQLSKSRRQNKKKSSSVEEGSRNNPETTPVHGSGGAIGLASETEDSLQPAGTSMLSTNNNPVDMKDKFLTSLSAGGFQTNNGKLNLQSSKHIAESSKNLVHVLQQFNYGVRCGVKFQKAVQTPVLTTIKDLELYRTASPFDRRVTAMEWHPSKPNLLAVGSKGGDIIVWDTSNVNKDKFIQGIGKAGSCQAMKFWPWDMDRMVSASINGTVTLHDFDMKQGTVLADTMDSYDHWYCSLDVNPSRYMIAAGRNNGILHIMSTEGRKVFEYRLHKNKVTHVEFSPREEWLLCTASVDQTVQLWDVRYMKDRKSALQVLNHDKPVNSAYFSETDGCRLLTTDQGKDIRVYRAPFWHLETAIEHPHRFFQHITPFKATWHPLQDLIVCGRYPDKSFPGSGSELRTIDVFEAETGDIVSQIYSHGTDGLCPLNKFNKQGDALASGMGFHILLWNRNQVIAKKQARLMEGLVTSFETPRSQNHTSGSSDPRSRPRPRQTKKRKTEEDVDDLKKKVKTKTSVKVKTDTTKSRRKHKGDTEED